MVRPGDRARSQAGLLLRSAGATAPGRAAPIEAADGTIKEMIAKNPKAGLAYVYRWRYPGILAAPATQGHRRRAWSWPPTIPKCCSPRPSPASRNRTPLRRGFTGRRAEARSQECRVRPWPGSPRGTGTAPRSSRGGPAASDTRPNLPSTLAFELAENLILQDKIDGKDQAGDLLAKLRSAGFGDTYVPYLETRILFKRNKWAEAIPGIENARMALKSDPRLTAQLDLMLAECYGRVGSEEQRLDALRRGRRR